MPATPQQIPLMLQELPQDPTLPKYNEALAKNKVQRTRVRRTSNADADFPDQNHARASSDDGGGKSLASAPSNMSVRNWASRVRHYPPCPPRPRIAAQAVSLTTKSARGHAVCPRFTQQHTAVHLCLRTLCTGRERRWRATQRAEARRWNECAQAEPLRRP